MDGRLFTVLALLVLPAVLIGLTVLYLGSNPVWVFTLIGVMVLGGMYLLTYTESPS